MRIALALIAFILSTLPSPAYPRDIQDTRLDPQCESTLMLSEVTERTLSVEAHGVEFHVYPEAVPDKFTGCQIVWLANGHRLATKHYDAGRISWIRGQEPKDVRPFFCVYKQGILNEGASFNIERCPRSEKDLQ